MNCPVCCSTKIEYLLFQHARFDLVPSSFDIVLIENKKREKIEIFKCKKCGHEMPVTEEDDIREVFPY